MIDKVLELLENPVIVISITIIVVTVALAIIIKNPNWFGVFMRKILKLNTDEETVKILTKFTENTKYLKTDVFNKDIIKELKKEI